MLKSELLKNFSNVAVCSGALYRRKIVYIRIFEALGNQLTFNKSQGSKLYFRFSSFLKNVLRFHEAILPPPYTNQIEQNGLEGQKFSVTIKLPDPTPGILDFFLNCSALF